MKCEVGNWIQMDKNTVKFRATGIVNTIAKFQVPLKRREFFLAQGHSNLKKDYATQFDK
jgi:hypothetical protein